MARHENEARILEFKPRIPKDRKLLYIVLGFQLLQVAGLIYLMVK